MKFRVGNFRVDTKTLIEVRMDGRLPRLYVHEKFEKPLKWIVWLVSAISFITIFIALDSYILSISIGLGLFALSFIFDRAIVKYTTFIVQPFPDFDIDYSQWYNVMTISDPDYKNKANVVGFVYKNMEYGKMFFNYIKSWNFDQANDKEKNIVLSIVEEPNGAFTFYIYANPYRKNLNKMFKAIAAENFITGQKKGKEQDALVMQMGYWHTINYTDDKHMRDFLKNQPPTEKFMFVPAAKHNNQYAIDIDSQIILHGYKYSKREDLHKYSEETIFSEMSKKWDEEDSQA